MSKSINILDKDYAQWIQDLSRRYRQSQLKAAVSVNTEMLRFYWDLGRDIVKMKIKQRWGEKVMARLSMDLREAMPGISGLTQRNIYYCKQFYLLYSPLTESLPQAGAKSSNEILDMSLLAIIFSARMGATIRPSAC